jgi:hypothetical protein
LEKLKTGILYGKKSVKISDKYYSEKPFTGYKCFDGSGCDRDLTRIKYLLIYS